jgi:type IV secretory pathway VirB2 component (pilin)
MKEEKKRITATKKAIHALYISGAGLISMAVCGVFLVWWLDLCEGVLVALVDWSNGPLGKFLATIFVVLILIGVLFKKVRWQWAIILLLGLFFHFSITTLLSAAGPGPCYKSPGLPLENSP